MQHDFQHEPPANHDRGLAFDLTTLMNRRHVLKVLSGAALFTLVGCSDDEGGGTSSSTTSTTTTSAAGGAGTTAGGSTTSSTIVAPIPTSATPLSACTTIPSETAGPFPGNGSNGPNALAQSGIIRSDIRASFGTSTNVARGIPLTMELTIVDTRNGCRPLAGAAVYIWHCDMTGGYSMYSQGVANENYLRGVQEADANGVVKYTSIFPAAYPGRWPHVHFEVYPSLSAASSSQNKRATSQLALPEAVCNAVYATAGYEQSRTNMSRTPLSRDTVFAEGAELQMATVTGDVSSGYAVSLVVGV